MLSVCKSSSAKCCRNRLSTQADSILGGDTWSGPAQAQRHAFRGCEAAVKMFLSTVTQTCHNMSVLQAAGPERRRNDNSERSETQLFFCSPRPISFLLTVAKPSGRGLLQTAPDATVAKEVRGVTGNVR